MLKSLINYRTLISSSVLTLALTCLPLSAGDFAVINMRRCFEQTKEGKEAKEMLENLNKEMGDNLSKIDDEIQQLSQQLGDKETKESLSTKALAELENKFEVLLKERDSKHNQFAQQMNQTQMLLTDNLMERVNKSAKEIANKQGFRGIIQQDAFIYFDDALDITDEVLKRADNLFEKDKADL